MLKYKKVGNWLMNGRFFLLLFSILVFSSCSTLQPQYGKNVINYPDSPIKDSLIHQITAIGNSNFSTNSTSIQLVKMIEQQSTNQNTISTLLILGDNSTISTHSNYKELKNNFSGKIYFLPSREDWKSGIEHLYQKQTQIEQVFGKNSYLPQNGCGIESIQLNNEITLIFINSQWYLEDWDKHKKLNENCGIKSREEFFKEFENQLNLNQNKSIIITSYHPMFSNGEQGGQFSAKQQLYPFSNNIPLPVFGTFYNFIRRTSGVYTQDLQNYHYRTFIERITSLTADRKNILFLSAHENNLQYIEKNDQKQIISGSATHTTPARAVGKNDFSFGGNGFASLKFYTNGSVNIEYIHGVSNEKLFIKELLPERKLPKTYQFNQENPFTQTAQIYPDELTQKSTFYKTIFGKFYRQFHSLPVTVPTLNLNSYNGGIISLKSEDQQQTRNLIIETNDKKQYTLQPLAKSATRYLQAIAFKNQYVEKDLEDTFTEKFLLDFYTTTNPYYQFAIPHLASSINLYHTNPKLYYLPIQQSLGLYNESFGDKLYLVEENPMKAFSDLENFGKPDDIIETEKLLQNLRISSHQKIDEQIYIRQRLFDMLIGDWDRYDKQWRWAVFHEKKDTIYRPIPIDRDQAFPNYNGPITRFVMRFPVFKHMQNFQSNTPNVKWLNMKNYTLDVALIKNATLDDWLKEVDYIKQNLTDDSIEKAFEYTPKEIQGEETNDIIKKLKLRVKNLDEYAKRYVNVLMKTVVIKATDATNSVTITRLPKGETKVQIFNPSVKGNQLIFEKNYFKNQTHNIWIYTLNGADSIKIVGKPEKPILVRIIGGKDNDVYQVSKGRKIRIYDFSSEYNKTKEARKAKIYLSRDYDVNSYDFMKPKYHKFSNYPTVGYNPDDGLKLGMSAIYTLNNFDRNPFTRQHTVDFYYYFATSGFEFNYNGIFAKFIGKWNLELNTKITSTNFSTNFFGLGNETQNDEKELGMDYNRVRTQLIRFNPSLFRINNDNSQIRFSANVENVFVEKTEGRFISTSTDVNPKAIGHQYFAEAGMKYTYRNFDNVSLPTLGMLFEIGAYWKSNLEDSKRSFAYLKGSLGFINQITKDETLTFGTLIKWQTNFNENFEFHQAASIGGDTDLRAYRSTRFTGRYSYSQSTDLRLEIAKIRRFIIPMKVGIIAGYDYGRVWMINEKSNKWHQAVGGGVWLNAIDKLTGKVNYFRGEDGGRFSLGVNFGF